ncbi:MAG: phosphoribosylformimino-5-aminoimidazole carboxamide ribotide isomerase [Blautia sp.]|nr:phosphoribosylformimino-5-aminoimidazole carboxamide ribotide isomerase [Blautia sp.]
MKFRPCIDIHNGRVKQIIGGSLRDAGDQALENFVSEQDAAFYARLYQKHGLSGGHVILLNGEDSPFYPATRQQALSALAAFPGGLQVGGGIRPDKAWDYLNAGASHVIVTSYVFRDGRIDFDRLLEMEATVGRERLVLDMSCVRREGQYIIVTDRWQKFTDLALTPELLTGLGDHCSEFLVHAVDVEGKARGVEQTLAGILGEYARRKGSRPVTYAGGIGSLDDMRILSSCTQGSVDFTIGSALSLFGGKIPFEDLLVISGSH